MLDFESKNEINTNDDDGMTELIMMFASLNITTK